MKKSSIIISIFLILVIIYYGAFIISENNKNNGSQDNVTNSGILEKNIVLISPTLNQKIYSSVELKGKARVFENTFNYKILDSSGNIIKEGIGSTDAKDVGLFGNFDIIVTFTPFSGTGSVEVFEYSAKDGSEVNKVIVPVIFENNL